MVFFSCFVTGAMVVVIVWQLGLQLSMQSVPFTINIVSLNPAHVKVYSIKHCDKVCWGLATGLWFYPGTLVSSTNKTDRNVISEILLNVVLNTITLTLYRDYLTYIITSITAHPIRLTVILQSVPKTFSTTSPGGKSGPTIHQPSLILTSPNKRHKLCYEKSGALPSWQMGRCWNIFIDKQSYYQNGISLDFSLVNHDTKHIPNLIQVNSTRLTT